MCERFAHRSWPRLLDNFARRLNPHLDAIEKGGFGGYYWVVDQAEIATDVMFRDRPALAAIMPDLIRHAALDLSSEDVLQFLGRKLHPSLAAEVMTNTRRADGWRVKHRLARNWIKVYNRVSVLRVETTINNPREFRVLRVFTDEQGRRERRWCEMNKGVANMWRYFQVGIGANLRYLDALAAAPLKGEGVAALDALCRSKTRNGRHHARFNPLSPQDLHSSEPCSPAGTPFPAFATRIWSNVSTHTRLMTAKKRIADARRVLSSDRQTSRSRIRRQGPARARLYRPTRYGYRLMTAAIAFHDDRFPDAYIAAKS